MLASPVKHELGRIYARSGVILSSFDKEGNTTLPMAVPLHARTRENDCQHADGGRSGCIEAVDACQCLRRIYFSSSKSWHLADDDNDDDDGDDDYGS